MPESCPSEAFGNQNGAGIQALSQRKNQQVKKKYCLLPRLLCAASVQQVQAEYRFKLLNLSLRTDVQAAPA
ncbi:hypothetical protein, partial [Pseudomonas viridiflava]|uniref:hypothetical protein n=1 Tax=Pseudomonas viridiflava TaxID=33069 RepID=UPI0019D301F5